LAFLPPQASTGQHGMGKPSFFCILFGREGNESKMKLARNFLFFRQFVKKDNSCCQASFFHRRAADLE